MADSAYFVKSTPPWCILLKLCSYVTDILKMCILKFNEKIIFNKFTPFLHIYPSLVLVQPRKTSPYITERLLMGRKESNQTKKKTTPFLT